MSFRALAERAALVLVSTALTLGALEAVFRVKDLRGFHQPRRWDMADALIEKKKDRVPGVSVQYKPHASFSFTYDGDPRGYLEPGAKLTYRTNNLGFRGPDAVEEKRSGSRRVVVLGDSFTFGEGVRLEHTFCARLPPLISTDGSVDVLNFGMSGWSTRDEVNYLQGRGLAFHPDLVIVVFVPNDADAPGLDLLDDFRRRHEARRFRFSYLASHLEASYRRGRLARAYMSQLVSGSLEAQMRWNRSFRYLSQGRDAARAAGAGYVVAMFPFMFDLTEAHPMRPIHDRVRAHCEAGGIPFVDLLPAFLGQAYTKMWAHPTDQHPNDEAHRIAAEALARAIAERGLLPPLRKAG